ncbi:helix-turn-helix transcriptional regulator [Streptacidiphilus albus]|uniref:helix-turn-helix transcriptional regulator n=1 Tax=Streptacidiphilus albus TaxID=105425 RepID=UPI00068C92EB|nr:helix-turn-helix transcriptional regulator [Streptacidiphilus albus]
MKLTPTAVAIYGWAINHGQISEADRPELAAELRVGAEEIENGLNLLAALRLLVPAMATGALTPASPDSAVAELVNPIEVEIKELEGLAGDLRSQVLPLKSMYFESRQTRNRREAVDVIDGVDRVRSMLSEASRACSVEILSAHPGIFSAGAIESSLSTDLELLNRGVRMRSLFQHPARVNPQMRELVGQLGRAGCEIRTCEEISDRIIIFDRETAFIPNRVGPAGAVVVREPSIVDFLYRKLEKEWSVAVPFDGETTTPSGDGIADEEIKRAILRMLATGAKDDLIARRLSISVRTCRRHVAEVMDELQASSRFQAGVHALRAGLLTNSATPNTKPAADTAADEPGEPQLSDLAG